MTETAARTDHAAYAISGDTEARRILPPEHLDRLGEAVLALTSELWILTDRMAVLEAVLGQAGIEVSDAITRFTPSPEMETVLDARRDKLIASVLAALQAPLSSQKT